MLNSNLLADRLNAFKNNEPIPDLDTNREYVYKGATEESLPLIVTFLTQFINIALIFVKSLGYGFALKTVFATDWSFVAFLSVGFAIELFLTTLINPFTKNK